MSTSGATASGRSQVDRSGQHRADLQLDEPTIGRLVADTSRHLSSLIRAEIALAKSELKVSVTAGGIGLALVVVAAFLGVLAIIMLSFSIAYWIVRLGLGEEWAFLIVFGGYLLLALILVFLAIRRFKRVKAPERTIATTKETVAALRRR